MTGEYDRISGRYEAVSPPIIVSLGIGYDPDPLTESWQIEFVEPPAESTTASVRGVATFSSEKYGTCTYYMSGRGSRFSSASAPTASGS